MIKIEEEKVPREKGPIFIDYSKIHRNPKQRLFFLRALIKLADSKKDIIQFEDLELDPGEIEIFKQYLKEFYPGKFRIYKKTFNKDDFDGKIICNIDLLIKDICEILSQGKNNDKLTDRTSEQNDINPVKNNIQTNDHDNQNGIKTYSRNLSNKYLHEIFHGGVSIAETQLFVNKVIKETKPETLEVFFNFSALSEEIKKIPLKVKNQERNVENVLVLKELIQKILKKFENQLPNKKYWEQLSIDTNDYFSKILEKCDQEKLILSFENGKKYEVTINEILLEENIKIFQAIPGIPDEHNHNLVISEYQKKKALFNFKCDLTEKISPNNNVLSKIIGFGDTFVIINPLKILTNQETSKLLSLGVEGYPSAEKIYSQISEVKE
jgi:hypothetical protein